MASNAARPGEAAAHLAARQNLPAAEILSQQQLQVQEEALCSL